MRKATWLGVCTLALVVAWPAAAEDKKEEKFDAAKLVGAWTYVSAEKNGENSRPSISRTRPSPSPRRPSL